MTHDAARSVDWAAVHRPNERRFSPATPVIGDLSRARAAVREVWSSFAFRACFESFSALEGWIQEQQLELAAIAAPTGEEQRRAQWLLRRFRGLGLQKNAIDEVGNVVGLYSNGEASAPALAVTAHLDTVFPAATDVSPRQVNGSLRGPGIADNCAGLAALLALARTLSDHAVVTPTPILLIANVGEEGEGNLRGMRHLFSHSEWRGRIGATIVLDGPGNDHATIQALASRRFAVTFRGPGGHSWSDAGAASPVHALCRAVIACASDVQTTRGLSSLNVGMIAGGHSVNSIPAGATMKVDARATDAQELNRVCRDFRQALQRSVREENQAARDGRVDVHIECIGERPAGSLPPGSRIIQALAAADELLGISTRFQCSSTDANIPLSLGREAIAIGGGGRGGGIHTLQEWYDPSSRELGLKRLLLLAGTMATCSS